MTSYNRSRTCRDDFISIGADLAEMTSYKSEQTYFAAHLLHGCTRAHQALLPSYPALPLQFRSRCPVAQPMSRFDIQVLRVFHSAHAAVAKPTFMHQAPLRRLQTTSYHTKIQISRLRDILQGRYTTDPCHYCIVSMAAMHYC